MRKHKLGIIIGLLTVTLFTLITGLLMARVAAATTQGVSAEVPQNYLAATPRNLDYLGLSFTQVDIVDSQAQGAIKKDQAIAAALDEEPGLKEATDVSAMLGFLLNTNLQQAASRGVSVDPHLADMGLVWLVTFHGIETSSSGPSQAPRYISNEYNIVIDAKTGKYVMAFPLYDVTPSPAANSSAPTSGPLEDTPLPLSNATPTIAPTVVP